MSNNEIYVVSAVRSAIGSFGGSLKDVPLSQLASDVTRAALERSTLAPEQIGHVVMGTVIPTEPRDAYLGRVAAMNAGIPKETPAFNVNRLCGSGLQAIVSAAQSLMLGDAGAAIAAGAESMSRGPYLLVASPHGKSTCSAAGRSPRAHLTFQRVWPHQSTRRRILWRVRSIA